MPANVQMFFNQINKIASFDIIDLDPFINKVLNLNETEPFNANFRAIGFNSMFFLNNMGSPFDWLCFLLHWNNCNLYSLTLFKQSDLDKFEVCQP